MLGVFLHLDAKLPSLAVSITTKNIQLWYLYILNTVEHITTYTSHPINSAKKKLNFMYHLLLNRVSQEMIIWREYTYLGTHIQMEKVSTI